MNRDTLVAVLHGQAAGHDNRTGGGGTARTVLLFADGTRRGTHLGAPAALRKLFPLLERKDKGPRGGRTDQE